MNDKFTTQEKISYTVMAVLELIWITILITLTINAL